MAKEQIFVGLEIGTSKVCAVVTESRPDGGIRILGIGETPSRGVRKGEIVDFSTASKCVHEALADAEDKSDVEINSVHVAVTGSHISSFNTRGIAQIPEDKAEIDEEDLREVEINAKEINIPSQNAFIHTVIQHYYVDGQDGVLNPMGMLGHKLEADFHIIHGVKTRIQNTIRCVRELNIEVDDIVVNSLASSQVVADEHQKELGCLVIDIGGGVTDYIAYADSAVKHTGVIAVGGDHITNDISIGLRIPITRAEKLKVDEGSALPAQYKPGDVIIIKNDSGFSGCEVERHALNLIIHARVKELFELLKRQVEERCSLQLMGSGVILTGGCSRLKGIKDVAESVFNVPVQLAGAKDVSGPTSALQSPDLSTAIGLAKYAQLMHIDEPRGSVFHKVSQTFGKLFGKIIN